MGTSLTMREDFYPHPVADPEAEGLPKTADDDSTAYDDVESPRIADGPEPAALPADGQPLAVDRYGTTAEEARLGESLDLKLDREVPDPALGDQPDRTDTRQSPISAESFDAEPANTETDVVDRDTSLDSEVVEARRDSPVSLYDTGLGGGGGNVGRIVEPDEGLEEDTEKDMVGYDAGAAGGGPSAEELAMHEVREGER